jgi:TrmH family RNA methyltransferase
VAPTPRPTLAEWSLPADAIVAVVEGAEKPGNIGAILRTADAVGVAGLIVADGGTDLYNPNAIRASLGAIFTVPVCQASADETLAWLRNNRFRILAARVDADLEYTQAGFRGRTAIVLGSEARGLGSRWQGADVTSVKLPLLGRVDSLNLSATAAVLFYEALRQRGSKRALVFALAGVSGAVSTQNDSRRRTTAAAAIASATMPTITRRLTTSFVQR